MINKAKYRIPSINKYSTEAIMMNSQAMLWQSVMVVYVFFVCNSIEAKDPPISTDLKSILEIQGYVEVPLVKYRGKVSNQFDEGLYVECNIGDQKGLLILRNEFANHSSLDLDFVNKLNLPLDGPFQTEFESKKLDAYRLESPPIKIGNYSLNHGNRKKNLTETMFTLKYSELYHTRNPNQEIPFIGILDKSHLQNHSVILDLENQRVFFLHPFDQIWSKIQGTWQAKKIINDGQELQGKELQAYVMDFEKKEISLWNGKKLERYGVDIVTGGTKTILGLYELKDRDNPELDYVGGSLIDFENNGLRLCLTWPGTSAKTMPTAMEAPKKGSGHIYMELERAK